MLTITPTPQEIEDSINYGLASTGHHQIFTAGSVYRGSQRALQGAMGKVCEYAWKAALDASVGLGGGIDLSIKQPEFGPDITETNPNAFFFGNKRLHVKAGGPKSGDSILISRKDPVAVDPLVEDIILLALFENDFRVHLVGWVNAAAVYDLYREPNSDTVKHKKALYLTDRKVAPLINRL